MPVDTPVERREHIDDPVGHELAPCLADCSQPLTELFDGQLLFDGRVDVEVQVQQHVRIVAIDRRALTRGVLEDRMVLNDRGVLVDGLVERTQRWRPRQWVVFTRMIEALIEYLFDIQEAFVFQGQPHRGIISDRWQTEIVRLTVFVRGQLIFVQLENGVLFQWWIERAGILQHEIIGRLRDHVGW